MLAVPLAAVYIGGTGANNVSAADEGKTFNYTCDADAPVVGEIEVDMEVEVFGDAPESVEPGEEFNIEDSYTKVTILDTETMKIAMDELEGQVTTFNLEADNEENTINVAEDPLDIPTTEHPEDSDEATLQVPDAPLTVESFKAGDEGTVEISAGKIINTLACRLGNIEATCSHDDEDTVVNTVDIEEESEEPEESTVTETHVDEDGEELTDSEEKTGEEGESYETEEADIDGYTLKEVNGDEEGEYGEDDATVEYVYEKEESEEPEESTVTVTHVDEDGEELADSKEMSGEEGESYETEEADIDGYTLKEVNGDEEGEYGED